MVKDFGRGGSDRGGRGGGFGGRGGPRGGGRGGRGGRGGAFQGPSGIMLEIGEFMHVTEKEMLFRATIENVPKFNRVVFDSGDDRKQQVGTINEILGPFNKYVGDCNGRCFL